MSAARWAWLIVALIIGELVVGISGLVCLWTQHWHPAATLLLWAWCFRGLQDLAERRARHV